MAVQMSVSLRNARLNAIATEVGNSGILEIRTGAQPANCAAADSGTLLASLTCNASGFAGAAASGVLTVSAVTADSSADATGIAAHYRLKTSGGTVVKQGTVTATGGGGDLTITSTNITAGETVSVTSWTITEPGA